MKATTTSEETKRLAMRSLGESARPSAARAFCGEFVPTLALIISTWTVSAHILYPRVAAESGWWGLLWGLGCGLLGIWLARAFVIMHDAGHGALAPTAWLNQLIGHACGVLVLTPMTHWSKLHWHHHRASGNLDKQDGLGGIFAMSVSQYLSLPKWQQILYRGFRHRLHFWFVVPSAMFFVFHRLPLLYFPWAGIFRKPKLGEVLNIVLLDALYMAVGWWIWTHWTLAKPWLFTYAIAILLSVTIGVILFYTQHQFERTYYAHDEEWSFFDSGIKGSMTLRLPFWWLEWAIGYVNFHSVHHLKPAIPLYRLPAAHCAMRKLGIPITECRVSDLREMFHCALWDEERQCMVSFADVELSR